MYKVCYKNCYQYLKLLTQYCKNDSGILTGINQYNDGRLTPLMSLLFRKHCNKKYLSTFLSFNGINVDLPCKDKYRKFNQLTAVQICEKMSRNDKNNKYLPLAEMITEYGDNHNNTADS